MTLTAAQAFQAQRSNADALAAQAEQDADLDVDLGNFLLDAANHVGLDMDLASSITDGTIERTMDGASTVSVTVHDAHRILLGSDLWKYTLEVELGGLWWRLVHVSKQGDDLILQFEDRVVAWMRRKKDPLKVSRNKMTRAEFIRKMINEIKQDNEAGTPLSLYSPKLHKKQPIASAKDKTKDKERRATRSGGLSTATKLTVKGKAANGEQIKIGEQILDVGSSMNANRKVLVSSIMVAIDESTMVNLVGGDADSRGVFQQQKYINGVRTEWPASRDVSADAAGYFKAAIAEDKSNPGLTLQMLCQNVQKSGTPDGSNYAEFEEESKKWVEEYGAGPGGSITTQYAQQYQFTRGQPGGPKDEDTWAAGVRLAAEVNWYFFNVGYTVYFVDKADLLASKPIMTIDEDDDGIETVDFDWDTGKNVNEVEITCRAEKWFAMPGEVVRLKPTLGPVGRAPADRWIVSRISRPIFSTLTTITLKQPIDPKKEPAPTLASRTTDAGGILTGGTVDGNGFRDKIVNAAELAMTKKPYAYIQKRPMPKNLYSQEAIKGGIDCSAFAILCYKAAGCQDPNGTNYNGTGNTTSLMANGHRVGEPQRGDLVFYANPDHVAVYVGDGMVIEQGGQGGPRKLSINYRVKTGVYGFELGPQTIKPTGLDTLVNKADPKPKQVVPTSAIPEYARGALNNNKPSKTTTGHPNP